MPLGSVVLARKALRGITHLSLFFLTSCIPMGIWDGGFPKSEVLLHITDREGHPLQNVMFRVYHGSSYKLANRYPAAEHSTDQPLLSDTDGKIVFHQDREGIQFGGMMVLLLGFIPYGTGSPEFKGELSYPGYRTISFSITDLLERAQPLAPGIQATVERNFRMIPSYD